MLNLSVFGTYSPTPKRYGRSLGDFSSLSSLLPNPAKSTIFFGNVPPPLVESVILATLEFPTGSLPIKYLGIPLASAKLSYNDCKPIIKRIISRVKSWSSKYLSYAGRVKLINSTSFSI